MRLISRQNTTPTSVDCDASIIIIIPCLREQDIIQKTLDHFLSILPSRLEVFIVVVTTQKEDAEKQSHLPLINALAHDILRKKDIHGLMNKYSAILSRANLLEMMGAAENDDYAVLLERLKSKVANSPTTFQLLNAIKKSNAKYRRVYVADYPKTEGMMAHQLNYVIENINTIIPKRLVNEKTYIGVYNADSMPSHDTFPRLMDAIMRHHFPLVMQQYATMTANFSALSGIMKGFALYQTHFELRNGLTNTALNSPFLRNHVAGHGLFLRLDNLLDMNGFETAFWCEDIYLSNYLKNENVKIYPLMSLESVEAPSFLLNQIKQHAVWFKTAFQFHKMWVHVRSRQQKTTLSGFFNYMQQLRATLAWLFLPFLVLFTLLYPFWMRDYWLMGMGFLSYMGMVSVNVLTSLSTIHTLTGKNWPQKHRLVLFTAAATMISNLGPLYSLLNPNAKKHKTIR